MVLRRRKTMRHSGFRSLALEPLESRQVMAGAAPSLVQPALTIDPIEQFLIEQVNRARAAPLAEASRYQVDLNRGSGETITSDPKQPLAPNATLQVVTAGHSQFLVGKSALLHTDDQGREVGDRATQAGYVWTSIRENLAATTDGVSNLEIAGATIHQQLFLSDSHRRNILASNVSEIGIGSVQGLFNYSNGTSGTSTIVTQNFGERDYQYFTGVAFDDSVIADNLYSIGEGRGGIAIEARLANGTVYSTTTSTDSGGYALAVPSGTYRVSALLVPGIAQSRIEIGIFQIGTDNIKVDVPPGLVPINGSQRTFNRFDITNDGVVAPVDLLQIINEINSPSGGNLFALDISMDNIVTPLDMIQLINYLNFQTASEVSLASASGEGESSYNSVSSAASTDIALMSVDLNYLESTLKKK